MRIAAIVQARLSSSRLPGKVLKELPIGCSTTVLERVINRLKQSTKLDEIIIATTTETDDDKLIPVAEKAGIKYFRGSKEDVLSRYYFASRENDIDVIVRITGDCPCIDPVLIDSMIERHLETGADFTSSILTRTFPHGLDTEIMSFKAMEKAHLQATQPFEREHVCPYIYKSSPEVFTITPFRAPPELCAPDIRITLDTEEDYALLCQVFDSLGVENDTFSAKDIISLFREKPWLKLINRKVAQKKLTTETPRQELKEAIRVLDLQELNRAADCLRAQL